MNQLAKAIRQFMPGQTAEVVVAWFGETVELRRNAVSQSLAGVGKELALQGVSPLVLIGLRQHVRELPIGGDTLEGFLLTAGGDSGGVDFTLPEIRQQLEFNRSHPATTDAQKAVIDGMLLIGIVPGPRWQAHSLEALPTVEQVQAAINQIAVEDWADHVQLHILQPMKANGSTVAQIKAAIASSP